MSTQSAYSPPAYSPQAYSPQAYSPQAYSPHVLEAADRNPARAIHGSGGSFRSMFKLISEALRDARVAEADYRIQVGRGVRPAVAAAEAFRRNGFSR